MWIIGWFALITTGFYFYAFFLKKVKFTSTAEFIVNEIKPGGENKNQANQVVAKTPDFLPFWKAPDLKQILKGDTVMADAFERYMLVSKENPELNTEGKSAFFQDPYPIFDDEEPKPANIDKFKACIKVDMKSAKSIIITAHSTNKNKSLWIVNSYLDAFKEYQKAQSTESLNKAIDQSNETLQQKQKLIMDINEEKGIIIDQLKKKYGEHLIWEKGPDSKIEIRDEIAEKIDEVDKEMFQLQSEIKDFEIYDPDRWLIEDGENNKIVELQSELYTQREELSKELANLRVDFTDKHPKVIRKLAELNSLNESFPRLAQDIVNKKLRELKRDLGNKKGLRDKLEVDMKRVNKEISIIQENHQTFTDFASRSKKYTAAIERVETHIDGLKEELEKIGKPINVTTKPAVGKPEVVAPNTKYYIMVFAIIIGLGFAYILEYIDDTIRTPHDVEKFVGLRVIGTVPLLSKSEEKLLHRIALKSPISEMMNTLSMIIQSWMLKMKGQVLLIVSSKPGEGKSTFITNLSVALCRGGEKVVLVDSDLRKPSLHRFFGVDNSVGLSNYLEDSFSEDVGDTDEAKIAKIVHHTDVEGLFIIPSGPIPSNPVGLLKSDNVERLINHLKTYIGVILIDTPPLAMIDAGVLATKVNAVVTVMDAGKVSKKEALAGKHLIENVGGNNIGVILNKVTLEGEEYYYYFEGYSYYYGSSRNRKKKPV